MTATNKNNIMIQMKFKLSTYIVVLSLLLTSCFEDQSDKLFRDSFVEFDETSFATNPEIYVNSIREDSRSVLAQVNLVGAHRSVDQTINFSVDSESTAIEGTNYRLSGNNFIIPANSSVGFINVELIDSSMDNTSSVTLILVLEGNNEIKPSENYKKITYQINGI